MPGDQVVDGVEVGGDVVADRGVRAAAGLHRGDPLVGQHGVAAQEVGVLGGVDVVGQHRQRQLVAQLPAQGGHQCGLAGTDGSADADAQRLPRPAHPAGTVGVLRAAGRRGNAVAWQRPSSRRRTAGVRGRAWRSASTSSSGSDRSARSLARVGGGLLAQRRQRERQRRDVGRDRARAGAARRSPSPSSWCRPATARSARAARPPTAADQPGRHRQVRRRRRARPSPGSGQTRRASRTRPAALRARRRAGRGRRCARIGLGVTGLDRRRARPAVHRRRERRGDQPAGADPARAGTPAASTRSTHQPAGRPPPPRRRSARGRRWAVGSPAG